MAVAYPDYSAEKVRGAAMILRQPWQRAIFMTGLFGGVVVLALLLILGF